MLPAFIHNTAAEDHAVAEVRSRSPRSLVCRAVMLPLLVLCCVPSPLFAADDLWTLYRLARNNDAQYRSEQLDQQAARALLPIARSRLGPNANAFASESSVSGISDDIPDYTEGSYGVELNQAIYQPSNFTAYQQAKIESDIADLGESGAQHALIMRLAQRYFSMLSATDDLQLSRSESTAIESQLRRVRERYKVGLGARTAVFEAEARFELARVGEIEAANALRDARQGVVELVGIDVRALTPLAANAELAMPNPASEKRWVDITRRQSVEIAVARHRGEIAKKEIKRLKREVYPKLDLSLSYSDRKGGRFPNQSGGRSARATLSLSVPLFSSGLARNVLYQTTIRYQSAQSRAEAVERSVVRAVRAAYQDVTGAIHRVAALNAAVSASESALRARRDEYETGLSTNIDVLDAQRDLFSARRDYLRARYNYVLALLGLKQISGTLGEKDVKAINALLASGG